MLVVSLLLLYIIMYNWCYLPSRSLYSSCAATVDAAAAVAAVVAAAVAAAVAAVAAAAATAVAAVACRCC